jgi:hypothetical protein
MEVWLIDHIVPRLRVLRMHRTEIHIIGTQGLVAADYRCNELQLRPVAEP